MKLHNKLCEQRCSLLYYDPGSTSILCEQIKNWPLRLWYIMFNSTYAMSPFKRTISPTPPCLYWILHVPYGTLLNSVYYSIYVVPNGTQLGYARVIVCYSYKSQIWHSQHFTYTSRSYSAHWITLFHSYSVPGFQISMMMIKWLVPNFNLVLTALMWLKL